MRLGVLGGMFDPIHYGHLHMGQVGCDLLGLDSLAWVPCATPPHRSGPQASFADRCTMVALAIQERPLWHVNPLEGERKGPSYMVETLAALRSQISRDDGLILLVGADAFAQLHRWHHALALFEHAHVWVAQRPGTPLTFDATLAPYQSELSTLKQTPSGHWSYSPMLPLDLSSTALREAMVQGHAPHFLLPELVGDYIHQRGLYQSVHGGG